MNDPVWVVLLVDRARVGESIRLLRLDSARGAAPTTSLRRAAVFPTESMAGHAIRHVANSGSGNLVCWQTHRVYLMVPAQVERPLDRWPVGAKPAPSPLLPLDWGLDVAGGHS